MLQALNQGLNFAALCEGLFQWVAPNEVALRATSLLRHWIIQGNLSYLS